MPEDSMIVVEGTRVLATTEEELPIPGASTNLDEFYEELGRDSLTFERWSAWGMRLREWGVRTIWAYIDWLVTGDERWNDMYSHVAEVLGIEEDTLRQYVHIGRTWPMERRRWPLPVTFYQATNAKWIPPAVAEELLDEAFERGWTREDLRKEVNERRPQIAPETKPITTLLPPPEAVPAASLAVQLATLLGDVSKALHAEICNAHTSWVVCGSDLCMKSRRVIEIAMAAEGGKG